MRVHGGEDSLSGKRHTLVEIIPDGPNWSDLDLPNGVLTYRRAIAQDG